MLVLILLILMAALGMWTLRGGLAAWRHVTQMPDTPLPADSTPDAGKVSIVAFALRDEENLSGYVDTLLAQEYADLEIVLVCDASAEATAMLSEKFESVPNLHITFIPPGSHNLSRHKLAQTIGIKAATGDVVVITDTSVWPGSTRWIPNLVAPLAQSHTAASLGYIHPVFTDYQGGSKWYRQFDHVCDTAEWMGAAYEGAPFRADGRNLAFRRKLFFKVKGYASTINLMDGDDDMFVELLAGYGTCVPVVVPESFLYTRWGEQTDRLHVDLKERYAFTRRFLNNAPHYSRSLTSWAQWLMPLGTLLSVALCMPRLIASFGAWLPSAAEAAETLTRDINSLTDLMGYDLIPPTLFGACAGTAAAIGIYLWFAFAEISLYRRTASCLEAVRLFWSVPLFMLWRPIGNFLFRLNHHSTRKSHFTWQR